MVHFLPDLLAKGHKFNQPIIEPDAIRFAQISKLMANKDKPRIAISWRGGKDANGEIRSMRLGELMAGLPVATEVEVISLQYDEGHEQEVITHGDRRVAFSGLNNRFDLEGVFALIKCCDAVITVDNAVAHFSAALGVPAAVLIPAAQTQYRWKQPKIKQLLFPSASLFVQNKPGDWVRPVEAAWHYVLEMAGNQPVRSQ